MVLVGGPVRSPSSAGSSSPQTVSPTVQTTSARPRAHAASSRPPGQQGSLAGVAGPPTMVTDGTRGRPDTSVRIPRRTKPDGRGCKGVPDERAAAPARPRLPATRRRRAPRHNATVEVFDPDDSGFDYDRLVALIPDRIAVRAALPPAAPGGARPARQPGVGRRRPTSTSATTYAAPRCPGRARPTSSASWWPRIVSRPLDRQPAALGDLLRRGARRRPGGAALQDPPGAGRRRRHRRPRPGAARQRTPTVKIARQRRVARRAARRRRPRLLAGALRQRDRAAHRARHGRGTLDAALRNADRVASGAGGSLPR